jgi:hypothetical protein
MTRYNALSIHLEVNSNLSLHLSFYIFSLSIISYFLSRLISLSLLCTCVCLCLFVFVFLFVCLPFCLRLFVYLCFSFLPLSHGFCLYVCLSIFVCLSAFDSIFFRCRMALWYLSFSPSLFYLLSRIHISLSISVADYVSSVCLPTFSRPSKLQPLPFSLYNFSFAVSMSMSSVFKCASPYLSLCI